jgi:hypothetical protein
MGPIEMNSKTNLDTLNTMINLDSLIRPVDDYNKYNPDLSDLNMSDDENDEEKNAGRRLG